MEKVNKNTAQIAYECFYDSLKTHGVNVDDIVAKKMCDHFLCSMRERETSNKINVQITSMVSVEPTSSVVTGFSVGQVVTLAEIENSNDWVLYSISPRPMDMTTGYVSTDRKMFVRFAGNATTAMIVAHK